MFKYSVIIPIYNAEKYIDFMIKSVLNQTYNDWELILVDDGSTDNSSIICDKYYYDDRINIIHKKNEGQMLARIEGIQCATGDYILVIDADDILDSNCLQKVDDCLKKNLSDVVSFSFHICDEKLKILPRVIEENKDKEMCKEKFIEHIIEKMDHQLWDKVIRSDIVKLGVLDAMTDRVKVNGDYALIIPIACRVNSVYFIDEPLYYYRVYNESISHNYSFQHIIDTDKVTANVLTTLSKYKIINIHIEELAYISYLNMISVWLEGLIESNRFTKINYNDLHNLQIYKQSFISEKICSLGIRRFFEMKIIRKLPGGYMFLVKILLGVRNIKKSFCGFCKRK